MAEAALGAAQWVVGKALDSVADGALGAWAASRNFGLNIEDLRMELLLVKATLEQAARKDICGTAMEELLQRLRDSAHNAEDLLDELDYFRIHDELHGTHGAADQHGRSGIHGLALNACHTVKVVGKHLASLPAYWFGANAGDPRQQDATQSANSCVWPRGRKRLRDDSSSEPNANQADEEASRRMPKLRKLFFPGTSSPHPHVRGDEDRGNAQETPMPEFNRVEFSQKMKEIVEKLQPMRNEVNKILTHCGPKTVPDIAQNRPITSDRIDEPKLYGRDHVMNSIIHDISKGQYCQKGLTVLPVVGPPGMGKTTLIQHIYRHQQVQNQFSVMIWICVSVNFHLDTVLEQIKKYTTAVESEKKDSTTEELIKERLKSKRFLIVLDDIWQIRREDDWEKLLSTLKQSQEKGCVIIVTTRFQAIAQQVKTTGHSIELNGLESEQFRKLFLSFVFGDEQCARDKHFLLETGDKIMEKLKGSPLAAKTVGRLLSKELRLRHWKKVLKSKEWEKQTDDSGSMSALRLSYDFLPFHLQRCFSYSALFPEDYCFRSDELISLWIGLDVLIPGGQNQTFDDIGQINLNDLVIHGFFKKEETGAGPCYVMHDLLHDLALEVASHDCLSLCLSDVGSVAVQPSIRHLSISTEDLGEYNALSGEKLKSELEKLKIRLKVENLQSLLLFGKMDENFAKIFGDTFGDVNALRVVYLPNMMYPVESMLHNFSGLVHLRWLCLGTRKSPMHLPLSISKFYHLRILDLKMWYGSCDLPEDMSNLAKLCHFYTPSDGELHSDIYNVGKLKLLEELKEFQVNKKGEGFEPKQLEHLTKLRELGIYNLEKIHTKEAAAQAKLIEKKYLRRLTLDWDIERSSVDFGVEAEVLESLQPHGDLQVLCIRGHRGPSCPTWLGDELVVEALESLHLDGVSWEVFPSLGKAWDLRELCFEDIDSLKEFIIVKSFCMLAKLELTGLGSFKKWVYPAKQESFVGGDVLPPDAHMFPLLQVLVIRKCPKLLGLPFSNHIVSPDWFPKLRKLEVRDCREFLPVIPISWIESLRSVTMKCVKMLKEFAYSESSGGAELKITGESDLLSLDQVLVFDKETSLEKLTLSRCPPLELKHLLMLTSLRTLIVGNSVGLVGPLGGGQSDVEWQLPVEYIKINDLNGNTGEELTELLPHLPKLSKLEIWKCKNIKKLVVGVDVQQTTQEASEMGGGEITAAAEEEDDGVLLFPAHLCDSLQELKFSSCKELVLVFPAEQESSLVGDLLPPDAHMFPLLQVLIIRNCPKLLGFPFSNHIISPDWFPKLQELEICDCPEFFLSVIPMSWIESLRHVLLLWVKLLQKLECSKSSDGVNLLIEGTGDLHSIDQVLVFDKETCLEKLTLDRCPPLELKHLLMLTSLRTLIVKNSVGLVGPLGGGQSDVEWQLPVEYIKINDLNGNTGEELTELLPHLPKLSKLEIRKCKNITKLVVGVGVQQTTQEASEMGGGEITAAAEEEDDGVLLFPPHLCDSLQELWFYECPELVLVDPPTLVSIQALGSLQRLRIEWCPEFLSTFSFSCHIFPSSLQFLMLRDVKGLRTLEPLSNLSSLTRLELRSCGDDLKCQGLWSLLTTGGQLNKLEVRGSHRFFADWDPNPRRALEDAEGGEEQQTQLVSSTLRELWTDDIAGLLSAPVCRFLSSSLTKLELYGDWCEGMERFSKEQEDALQLLSSLQELEFWFFKDLQQLPAGLRNLTNLKILSVNCCPAISSLPNDALSDSLEKLDVYGCSVELKQYCRGLEGTIPELIIN